MPAHRRRIADSHARHGLIDAYAPAPRRGFTGRGGPGAGRPVYSVPPRPARAPAAVRRGMPMPTVKDARGESITTTKRAERVVSLVPSVTESVARLCGARRLVGITKFCTEPEATCRRSARSAARRTPTWRPSWRSSPTWCSPIGRRTGRRTSRRWRRPGCGSSWATRARRGRASRSCGPSRGCWKRRWCAPPRTRSRRRSSGRKRSTPSGRGCGSSAPSGGGRSWPWAATPTPAT